MFCKSCGAKIENGSKFCAACGTAVAENLNSEATVAPKQQPTAQKASTRNLEIYMGDSRCAGPSATRYYAFTFYIPILVVVLGLALSAVGIGIPILIIGIIFALVIRKIFKQSVLYDENEKCFVLNEHSKLKFARKSININEIKSVQYRYVKIGGMQQRFSLDDSGKYHAFSFIAKDEAKNFFVFFHKDEDAKNFFPIIEYAFESNNISIAIDKNEELIKYEDWEKEIQEAQS